MYNVVSRTLSRTVRSHTTPLISISTLDGLLSGNRLIDQRRRSMIQNTRQKCRDLRATSIKEQRIDIIE